MSKELLKKLVELIPDKDSAQMVVDGAELPSGKMDFSGAPKTMWYKILVEAKKHNGGLVKIIDAALEDYSDDEVLIKIRTKILENNKSNDVEIIDEPDVPEQLDVGVLKTLVAQGKISEAVKVLSENGEALDSDFQNQLILFQARYSKLSKDNRSGIMSQPDYQLGLNRLTHALLSLIDSIST